ncbi:prepilin-type N-terminal cleavage/methylation domain-containing protein [Salinimonas marina]|uniref:Prepilin-type N-terminal cleavage/methylation domain-containing protein n=1 Tax=Salinimonas marina TaxID=2785918 RepID=A0A7S9DYV8_9ALTE|nr:type IV pilin protein [Salinimonas marina]QPG06506.1 prepilin-type N-terminal cleavage/methylation domain-containing protein [Salinimonas marina]
MTRSFGFTLLELMIALAISAILAIVAVPGYQHIIEQANLNNARLHLLALQSAQESFYLKFERYAEAHELPVPHSKHYIFAITAVDKNYYQLSARSRKPGGRCAQLTLTQKLQKQPEECW